MVLKNKTLLASALTLMNVSCSFAVDILDLGTLGGDASFAVDVNEGDHSVGIARDASGDNKVFLHTGKDMFETPLVAATSSLGINVNSLIAGCATGTDGVIYPAIFNAPTNELQILGSFGGTDFGFNGTATAINTAGKAVGYSYLPNGDRHAFLFDGWMQDIGRGHNNYALAINDSNTVVGGGTKGAWKWTASGGTAFLRPFGFAEATARSVNSQGEIVGDFFNNVTSAFLLSNGIYTLVTYNGTAYDINDTSHVVGTFYLPTTCSACPPVQHAFEWVGGVRTDLNSLVVGSGWVLTNASAINNVNHIVGWGVKDSQTHGYLLKP